MLKYLKISALALVSLCGIASGQNLVGLKEREIIEYMAGKMPDFIKQRDVKNPHYNYLRYQTAGEDQTLLIFLDNKGKCREVRYIFEKNHRESVVREYDSTFLKVGDNLWKDKKGRKEYSIMMSDETWYYNVTIRETGK